MSYAPAIPLSGYAGWTFLSRTLSSQTTALTQTPQYKRDEDYFRANIGKIDTAEQLVKDRRLLGVALGAFGLDNDINNKFFIQKVLQDGTFNPSALANKLADKQYQKLSAAFGFGDLPIPRSKISDFADKILGQYRDKQFERAVGTQNNDFRLALNLQRELPQIANNASSSENAKWFSVMGSTPLRTVFQTALGLPASTAQLDLDQQLSIFKSKAKAQFGSDSLSQFAQPAAMDKLVKRYLLRSELDSFSQTNQAGTALTLMQQALASQRRYRV
ncbi:MAG: DUF1217 domain-containing protein [Cypionkella sp.]|nr:DUF1217 domain-containing protein [Cypionkella sp.]